MGLYIYICVCEFCDTESMLFFFYFGLAMNHESYKLSTLSRLELRRILCPRRRKRNGIKPGRDR